MSEFSHSLFKHILELRTRLILIADNRIIADGLMVPLNLGVVSGPARTYPAVSDAESS